MRFSRCQIPVLCFFLMPLLLRAVFAAESPSPVNLPVYPDDAYSRPAEDHWNCFETTCGITLPGNVFQRAIQWNRNELLSARGGDPRETQWRFNRKRGVTDAPNIGFFGTVRRAPESIAFHVRNCSPKPVSFTAVLYEFPWNKAQANEYAQWTIPAKATVGPGSESDISFPLSDMTGPQQAKRKPWYPARLSLIVANTVEDETEYDLSLSNLTFHYSAAPGISVSSFAVPKTVRVSETVIFSLEASGIRTGSVVDIEVRAEPSVLWRIRLTQDEKGALSRTGKTAVTRTVPWYLPSCELTAGLVVDGYRAAAPETRFVVINKQKPALSHVSRASYHGRPTFLVNGKPLTWSGYASYDYQPGNVGEFGSSGADMFVVATDAGRHVHQVAAPTWTDNGKYDFSELDERVAMGLGANPDAFVTLRVSLALPPFWIQDHPESKALIRADHGDFSWEETGTTAVSIESEAWRNQQAACLRKLLQHCKAQPWANRVFAVILAGEVTEEWFMWASNDGQYADYSPLNTKQFASWCRDKRLPFKTIPSPVKRNRADYDVYPPDEAGRTSAAYAQYCSDRTADTIAYFAKVVKRATDRRVLVGAFYGYVIQLAGEPRQHLSGHFALSRLLACPDIDYLLGIPLHNFRNLTQGYDLYTSATESIFAHGKAFVNENDLFSWLHNSLWHTEYDPANPRAAAIKMHQRVAADDMVHGVPRQWFSLQANWHHDADLQKEFAREIALNRAAPAYDRTSVDEVAFVVDDTTFASMPPKSTLPRATNADFLFALGRTGAPVGVWLLSDLDRLPARVRVVVIANATCAKTNDLAKLRRLIEEGGRTIIVNGPAGLVNPDTYDWDLGATGRLTALPVIVEDTAATGKALLTVNGTEVSHIPSLRPRARIEGPGWLRYADGKTAGGERPLANGGRLIWCGAPPLGSSLIRGWVETAGVHCYAPLGFTVHASAQLVAVTAPAAGKAVLRWPHPVAVKDLFDGWTGSGPEMTCPFDAGQTRLFVLQTP